MTRAALHIGSAAKSIFLHLNLLPRPVISPTESHKSVLYTIGEGVRQYRQTISWAPMPLGIVPT